MPLPPDVDKQVRQRFSDLIDEASTIIENMKRDNSEGHARLKNIVYIGEIHYQNTAYHALATKAISLVSLALGKTDRANQIISDIRAMESSSTNTQNILGILYGLKDDYESGMLASLPEMIEANIVADYMGQAEQLLGEGVAGQFDHVPAAVLAGAVLEDALRRLCQRQSPPIDIVKVDAKGNSQPKMMNDLINDLKKAGLYNELKAKQLRAWADIRNAAAHGKFQDFERSDVEPMIEGINKFLADNL